VTPNVQLNYFLAVTQISKLQVVITTRVEHKDDEKVCIEYFPHTTIWSLPLRAMRYVGMGNISL
jgi:hypothetical protein